MEKTQISSDSPSFLTTSTLATTSTSTSASAADMQNKAMDLLDNKYVKAVLYIILILYASVIAPKLPNWIMPYLEEPLFKIFIVLLIGLLATKDPTAAIIATIGVTVTYLFIKDYKYTNIIKNITNNEIKDIKEFKEAKLCDQNQTKKTVEKTVEKFNTYGDSAENAENTENDEDAGNIKSIYNTEQNIEYFNDDDEYEYENNGIQNVEHFDVMHNNNSFIDHREEYLNTN